jgi:putative aldouronate transport system permease protein
MDTILLDVFGQLLSSILDGLSNAGHHFPVVGTGGGGDEVTKFIDKWAGVLINNLGMLNTIWAIILPPAFNVYNMIVARTYYQGIPRDLREAADVDGASELVYFFQILLPVCAPIIATLAMWQFVGMWNSYFDAMVYLNDAAKQPLQLVLRSILIQNQPEAGMVADMQSTAQRAQLAELLKYATIIISSLPLLVMYPFFQRYFDSGIMAGAVKG